MMIKSILLSAVIWVAFSVAVFAQTAPLPAPPPLPPLPQFCGGDILYVSNWNYGSVTKICASEGAPTTFLETMYGIYGARKIIPVSEGFYAVGFSKLFKMTVDGYGRRYQTWRIPADGIGFNPDPDPWSQSLSFRYPMEGEGQKVWLNWGGGIVTEDFQPSLNLRCSDIGSAGTTELCLDPRGWIFKARSTPFGPVYSDGEILLINRQPIDLAAFEDSFYVALGNTFKCSSTAPNQESPSQPTACNLVPGKLIALRPGNDGTLKEEVLVENLDLPPDPNRDHIAVSSRGVYFLSNAQNVPAVGFYSFRTRQVSKAYVGNEIDFFGAISIEPRP